MFVDVLFLSQLLIVKGHSSNFLPMKPPPAHPNNFHHYTPKYKFRARALRRSMTKAEKKLWQMIWRKSIHGFLFNRQRPVLHYIADFMCMRLKLIIEVDGGYHDNPDQMVRDAKRDSDLKEIGFTILRFKNWEVLHDPNGVYNDIKSWVEKNMKESNDTDSSFPLFLQRGSNDRPVINGIITPPLRGKGRCQQEPALKH